MPIQTGDLRIVESDTMADVDEGGGAITNNVIVDGDSNNIFEDISTLDRVYGAVHMRKVFPHVNIQTTDKYFGSHVIISKLPKDEKIGINLFNTEDWFDRRPEAQTRVENYRAKGSKYSGFLWATQWKDSKVITIFQNDSSPTPGVGEVLYVTNQAGTEFQYIKITKYAEEVQTFTDSSGDFTRVILSLEISQGLEYDFEGSEMSRYDTLTPDAEIRNTVVANASKYYSARYLKNAGISGDLSVQVDDVYSQVIPSSLQEVALTDVGAGGENQQMLDSSQTTASFNYSNNIQTNTVIYLGSPCLPGTLDIIVSGGNLTDDGGQIKEDALTVGTINYSAGTLTFGSSSPTYTGTKIITFKPASAPVQIADTASLAVGADNRGYVWTITLFTPPEPGSIQVSYMALGEWYDLYDDATGGIFGQESGIGTGTVNYVTGTISLTLSALPDADSAIVFLWGHAANYFNRSDFAVEPVVYRYQLSETGIARGTLVISWNDGTARTATADDSGVITGDASGMVNHTTGETAFSTNLLPLGGTTFTIDYQFGTPLEQTFLMPGREGDGDVLIDLGVADLVENSIEVEWNTLTDRTGLSTIEKVLPPRDPIYIKRDDGAGSLETITDSLIDYVAGTVRWNPDIISQIPKAVFVAGKLLGTRTERDSEGGDTDVRIGTFQQKFSHIEYVDAPNLFPDDGSEWVKIRYRVADSPVVMQDTFTADSMDIDLTEQFAEKIVTGSVRFTLGGETYIDRNGSLYYDVDHVTGAGIYAGTVSYSTGVANITSWTQGGDNTVGLESLSTGIDVYPVEYLTFIVPQAPVKTQSLQIRVTPVDGGGEITATADEHGFISSDDVDGFITYATGLVELRFGAWVVASGNESEDWYDVNAVVDGNIFKPRHVFADTLLYNAVSQTFLPLDSDILGLDPVRLPVDGKIPVYSDGDVIVVLHDNAKQYTPNLNEVLTLSNLSVKNNSGQEVNAETYYTVDFTGQTLTWASDLTALSQPVTISNNRDLEITADTYSADQVVDISSLGTAIRGRVAKLIVRDSANQTVLETKYTADLDTGTITFDDVSAISFPLNITDRIEDMSVVSDVQITGTLTLTQPLTHNFPVDETLVSNAVIYGDLFARPSIPFDQVSWTGVWSDDQIGSDATGEFNQTQYPIEIDNASSLEERWVFIFTTSTSGNLVGENVGQILSGVSISDDIAPINPNTAQPYFTLPNEAWGAGWSAGNCLRFNTKGANMPVWLIQSVGQGEATDPDFDFCIELRGDIDTIV